MRIGVVSDTHIPKRAKLLPRKLIEGLKGVDLILHAGDWVSLDVLASLKKIAPVNGVAGNNDGGDIRKMFGLRKILSIHGFKIGLVHGDGVTKTTIVRAKEAFIGKSVDIIIFGHSHKPYNQEHEGVLLFNPGSPTDKRRQTAYSYGIIELNETIKATHFFFRDKS